MNYHVPVKQDVSNEVPTFMLRRDELICPQNIYRKEQYPNLPCDMVKVTAQDGSDIFVPISKLTRVSSMDV
jgi:hypothetical protein